MAEPKKVIALEIGKLIEDASESIPPEHKKAFKLIVRAFSASGMRAMTKNQLVDSSLSIDVFAKNYASSNPVSHDQILDALRNTEVRKALEKLGNSIHQLVGRGPTNRGPEEYRGAASGLATFAVSKHLEKKRE